MTGQRDTKNQATGVISFQEPENTKYRMK